MEMVGRKLCVRLVCFFLAFFLVVSWVNKLHAASPTYPDRPINLVTPYNPGGMMDVNGRILAEAMERHLKQPVVIVNRPGGVGTIAGNAVATAKPDGYTLGFLNTNIIFPEIYTYFYEAPYSSKDLAPICNIVVPLMTVTVKGDAPWNNLKAFLEFSKQHPGAKVGILGKSHNSYLSMTVLSKAEKITFGYVPFDGDGKLIPAVLGGHIAVGIITYPAIRSLLEAKKLKALAFCLNEKVDVAPNIPTLAELGYHLPYDALCGIFAPKGTPKEVLKKLDEVFGKISKEQEVRAKISSAGSQLNYLDTASFEKAIISSKEKYHAFFKEEGLVKQK